MDIRSLGENGDYFGWDLSQRAYEYLHTTVFFSKLANSLNLKVSKKILFQSIEYEFSDTLEPLFKINLTSSGQLIVKYININEDQIKLKRKIPLLLQYYVNENYALKI